MSDSDELVRSNENKRLPTHGKHGPLPGEGGAPVKELDLGLVHRLAMIQCTDREIADCLEVSEDTITRRKQNDPAFLDVLERGRGTGRMALRRKQWEAAQSGNPAMLIWLGKQLLGQRDRFEHGQDPERPFTVLTGVPRADPHSAGPTYTIDLDAADE